MKSYTFTPINIVYSVIVVAVLVIAGKVLYDVSQTPPSYNTDPLVMLKDKGQLFQVVTFDDEPVTVLSVELYPKYKEVHKKVYVNFRSQFVYSDGSGIAFDGSPIYFNREGDIMTYDHRIVPEPYVFFVGETEMPSSKAMTLRDIKSSAKAKLQKSQAAKKAREEQTGQKPKERQLNG